MISRTSLVLTLCLLAGCKSAPIVLPAASLGVSHWQGRLALRIHSEPARAFNAAFELQGSVQAGELTFFTPLGSTAAVLRWTAQSAQLQRAKQLQNFDSLDDLIAHALETPVPAPALFAWLAGQNQPVAGWRVDLSQHRAGRIQALRHAPLPSAELKIVLDPH